MVLAVGPYTRLVPYLDGSKTYLAEVFFGRSTTTGDAGGQTVAERPISLAIEEVASILPEFIGNIWQRPHAYSAVKVAGERAYALARRGNASVLPEREITIRALKIVRMSGPSCLIRVECSAGTYIRTLAEDLGGALNIPAHLAFLLRINVGVFNIAGAQRLDEADSWMLWPAAVALPHLPQLSVTDPQANDLRRGQRIEPADGLIPNGKEQYLITQGGLPLGIGESRHGSIWPKVNLM